MNLKHSCDHSYAHEHIFSIAVDTEGSAYTWGNGGYGRLGHKVQQDEHSSKKVEGFTGRISVPADAVVSNFALPLI